MATKAEQAAAEKAAAEQAAAEQAAAEKAAANVRGRALVDLPDFGLACGDYAELAAVHARGLIASGQFDDCAPWPVE